MAGYVGPEISDELRAEVNSNLLPGDVVLNVGVENRWAVVEDPFGTRWTIRLNSGVREPFISIEPPTDERKRKGYIAEGVDDPYGT